MHSTQSDGELSTDKIVKYILQNNIKAFSVTDHDTITHISLIQEYLANSKVSTQFIPGVEVSCIHSDYNIHILLYGQKIDCSELRELFKSMHSERCNAFLQMGEKLNDLGYKIDYKNLLSKYSNPGRPHLAKELVNQNLVSNFRTVFDTLLGYGKPAYVQKNKPSAKKILDIAQKNNFVSSLAHYGVYQDCVNLDELVDLGLNGLEIYHPDHSVKVVKYLLNYAKHNSLLITGGSDFHTRKTKNNIGTYGVDKSDYTLLLEKFEC
jgi:hypothetical protein